MAIEFKQSIQSVYDRSQASSLDLFQTLLDISKEIGWDQALALLEQCVIERRLNWWNRQQRGWTSSGDPCRDAFDLFYQTYLGASIPEDGEIVSADEHRWVMRWWNECPTLTASQHFGLDTREVCRKVYERPVQELFERIHPGLKFHRNYEAIRPYVPYCEEIIELDTID